MIARAPLVHIANDVARASRRGGAPVLSADSDPETIARWLQWNDPNGIHTAELAATDDCDAYDDVTAWDALAEALSDA